MRPRMRTPPPRKPPDDLAELRRLINQPERDKLRDLRDRFGTLFQGTQEL